MTEILETPKLVTVFGGSGFIGRHVVQGARQARLSDPRRHQAARACRPSAAARQCRPDPAGAGQSARALVGRPRGRGRRPRHQPRRHPLSIPARRLSRPCRTSAPGTSRKPPRQSGARLTHGSAIGADANSRSAYARTKARGEKAVFETVEDAVIFRPSIVFGPEDQFFNRFANMARYSPVLPLIGGGKTRFQPVFVGDVAEAIARSVDGDVKGGQHLRARRPERAHLPPVHGRDARSHRPQAAVRAGAMVGGRDPGRDPRHAAEAAVDARPGHAAQDRQCRLRGGR